MNFLYLFPLTLLITAVTVYAQNEDIPVESDNQFPPDHLESDGLIEGSGAGVVEEPNNDVTTEIKLVPELENIESTSIKEQSIADLNQNTEGQTCPKPCVCSIEGDTNNYIVDCSGYALTEFPSPIDPKTTTLNLHNNKLTEIPKEVSSLKNLKVLNANNNQIMELVAGSISELPELVTLNLANNRLIEYPRDLKNGISLNKLEELDLGGNDMRTTLSLETFSNFIALRKLTLPTETTSDFVLDLCGILKDTLETICTESCSEKTFDCPEAPQTIEEGLLNADFPVIDGITEDNSDPSITTETKSVEEKITENSVAITTTETIITTEIKDEKDFSNNGVSAISSVQQEVSTLNNLLETPNETQDEIQVTERENEASQTVGEHVLDEVVPGMIALDNAEISGNNEPIIPTEIVNVETDADSSVTSKNTETANTKGTKNESPANEFSLRSAVDSAPQGISSFNSVIETPKENQDEVKVGAKTSDSNTGGVNKSVIGLIVAGMIVVVAGVTLKKNWSSIKKRFSSTPRPNERTGNNVNGTTPEEVPLQDKSPV